jgi:hypothetical protein
LQIGVWGLTAFFGGSALGGAHTWDVNELFSNADGTIQFIELRETNGTNNETGVSFGTMSSNTKSFSISGSSVTSQTANKYYLIATASFAALPGAPTPDAIIPAGVLPYFFSINGDSVRYASYDTLTFGAAVLPTDGVNSLNRNLTTGPNSPTNYAGDPGSVDASPPIPAVSTWGLIVLAALIACAGTVLVAHRRTVAA